MTNTALSPFWLAVGMATAFCFVTAALAVFIAKNIPANRSRKPFLLVTLFAAVYAGAKAIVPTIDWPRGVMNHESSFDTNSRRGLSARRPLHDRGAEQVGRRSFPGRQLPIRRILEPRHRRSTQREPDQLQLLRDERIHARHRLHQGLLRRGLQDQPVGNVPEDMSARARRPAGVSHVPTA